MLSRDLNPKQEKDLFMPQMRIQDLLQMQKPSASGQNLQLFLLKLN